LLEGYRAIVPYMTRYKHIHVVIRVVRGAKAMKKVEIGTVAEIVENEGSASQLISTNIE
jgi:hypothetical protein